MWLEWLVENQTVVSRRELTNDVRRVYTGEGWGKVGLWRPDIACQLPIESRRLTEKCRYQHFWSGGENDGGVSLSRWLRVLILAGGEAGCTLCWKGCVSLEQESQCWKMQHRIHCCWAWRFNSMRGTELKTILSPQTWIPSLVLLARIGDKQSTNCRKQNGWNLLLGLKAGL